MKLKYMVFTLIIVTSFFGCSKEVKKSRLSLKKAFIAENMTNNNAIYTAGIYKDFIYYLQEYQDKYIIRFMDYDGNEKKKIIIRKGKGPGEVLNCLGLEFINDKIYLADNGVQRITILNSDGSYFDEITYDSQTGFIFTFDMYNKNFYYHSMNSVYFGRINKKGKSKVYKKRELKGQPEDKERFMGGVLKVDKNEEKIYFSHIDPPYRIIEYDLNFNRIEEIRYDYKEKIEPANWLVREGHMSIRGDILASSLKLDDKYLYSSLNGGRINREIGDSLEVIEPRMLVFDKENHECLAKVNFEKLDEIRGLFSIIGTTEEYVVLHILENSKRFKKILGNENYEGGGQAILIYKKGEKFPL